MVPCAPSKHLCAAVTNWTGLSCFIRIQSRRLIGLVLPSPSSPLGSDMSARKFRRLSFCVHEGQRNKGCESVALENPPFFDVRGKKQLKDSAGAFMWKLLCPY